MDNELTHIKYILEQVNKSNSIEMYIRGIFEGLAEVLREDDEIHDMQERLEYGHITVEQEEEYVSHLRYINSFVVTYGYQDPYDDYSTISKVEYPFEWIELYVEGDYEELKKVVITQQRELELASTVDGIKDLERVASGFGYKLVKEV